MARFCLPIRTRMACAWRQHPARLMSIIGVTGTDGKTTTTELIAAILMASGYRVSLINSLGASIAGRRIDSMWHLTTPGPFVLQTLLAWMKRFQSDWVIIETSSHGLAQGRLGGIVFEIGVVTNLAPEHLDYHRDLDRYLRAKGRLIRQVAGSSGAHTGRGVVVLNRDDPFYGRFAALRTTGVRDLVTYGLGSEANIRADDLDLSEEGSRFEVQTPSGRFPVEIRLPGRFNIYNALAAVSVGDWLRVDPAIMAGGLAAAARPKGRMTSVALGQRYRVMIDFAHTPQALEQVLRFYRLWVRGRIILLFGCSGERDPHKRPVMGEIAGRLADYVVVTRADNRSESLEAIKQAIAVGLHRAGKLADNDYAIIPDRRAAIRHACALVQADDLVLITGKGHETLLNVDGQEMPWDEEAVVRDAIALQNLGTDHPALARSVPVDKV
ncbi:MAG: UDP-N-acetylmuramyl-tripeptide synthetase [Candidatus Methylomirabilis sp.]